MRDIFYLGLITDPESDSIGWQFRARDCVA